jgi:hypothetical protein
VEADVVTTGV